MKRWYVVYTHQGAERVADGHLQRQGFQTFLPLCRRTTRHARRETTVTAPLFPRYLFVALEIAAERWRAINSTFGVKNIVSMGERPVALPDGIVDEIMARGDEKGLLALEPEAPFEKGETVHITGGPLADAVGFFQRMNEKNRVSVLLDMLGRRIEVQVPLKAVRAFA